MKIILNGKEVEKLASESLPMLIHGEEKCGASMYTIALAAKWFFQGYKIICLSGYHAAEEEFTRLVGEHKSAIFYTKEKVEDFKKDVVGSDAIVIIKNIELFDVDVVSSISARSLILSGDINKSSFKNELLKIPFASKVYFSPLDGNELTQLKKYEGLVISGNFQGITGIEK